MEKSGGSRKRERAAAMQRAREQSRGLTRRQSEALEKVFLDPHIAGIRDLSKVNADNVTDSGEMEELAKSQSWVRRAWENGEIIIKVSIRGRGYQKTFAVRVN